MSEVTIPIPKEIEDDLKAFSPISWQLFAQRKLSEELEKIAEFKRIVSKSKMTQEQADALSDEVNWALSKRYQKLYGQKFKGK